MMRWAIMENNRYIIEQYLTPGMTRDNFIFEDCTRDFLSLAYNKLLETHNRTKSLCLYLSGEDDSFIIDKLQECDSSQQKQILCSEYILQSIMNVAMHNEPEYYKESKALNKRIKLFKNGMMSVADFCLGSDYLFEDLQNIFKSNKRIEINFFLDNITNVDLQKAINNYISSRTPYSVKIFSNNKLCTHYDGAGNIIQSPHDYMSIYKNSFSDIPDEYELQ